MLLKYFLSHFHAYRSVRYSMRDRQHAYIGPSRVQANQRREASTGDRLLPLYLSLQHSLPLLLLIVLFLDRSICLIPLLVPSDRRSNFHSTSRCTSIITSKHVCLARTRSRIATSLSTNRSVACFSTSTFLLYLRLIFCPALSLWLYKYKNKVYSPSLPHPIPFLPPLYSPFMPWSCVELHGEAVTQ